MTTVPIIISQLGIDPKSLAKCLEERKSEKENTQKASRQHN